MKENTSYSIGQTLLTFLEFSFNKKFKRCGLFVSVIITVY